MNSTSISSADDKPEAAPAGSVRLIGPPGPSRAVQVGRITYVSSEGRTYWAPPADAKALIAAGWPIAA
jgi:hypothetical protein